MRRSLAGLGLLFRLSALTLGATFGSLLLGLWLDRMMNTAPFCTLFWMILGILVGTIGVYRSVKEANQSIDDAGHRHNSTGGT